MDGHERLPNSIAILIVREEIPLEITFIHR